MSTPQDSESASRDDLEKVDIPVTVPRDMAENIVDDLRENGRVKIFVSTDRTGPDIIDQIEWQLENDEQALEFVEEYDGN